MWLQNTEEEIYVPWEYNTSTKAEKEIPLKKTQAAQTKSEILCFADSGMTENKAFPNSWFLLAFTLYFADFGTCFWIWKLILEG